jgi:hypothetical protein
MDTSAGGVKTQLANRNAHPVDTKITETQNAGAIGDDSDLNIMWPVLDHRVQVAAIFEREVETCVGVLISAKVEL